MGKKDHVGQGKDRKFLDVWKAWVLARHLTAEAKLV